MLATRAICTGFVAVALGGVLMRAPAFAARTPAGTMIQSSATVSYELPTGPITAQSPATSLRVDEVLDAAVGWLDAANVQTAAGAIGQVLRFSVTNTGNGNERFLVSALSNAASDDFDPVVTGLAIDSNGDGLYDASTDAAYSAGVNDPVLAPDSSRTFFVLSSIPDTVAGGQRGQINLDATAATGTGAPGTIFPGVGDGGGDAIVGATRAAADAAGAYAVADPDISFVKTATVEGGSGRGAAASGDVLTYRIAVTVNGSGSLPNLEVLDAIPVGVTYLAGSLTLDGAPLTDAGGDDAGRFAQNGIAVALGTVAAGGTHTVTFRARID